MFSRASRCRRCRAGICGATYRRLVERLNAISGSARAGHSLLGFVAFLAFGTHCFHETAGSDYHGLQPHAPIADLARRDSGFRR
jgi:hypothetical protein